MGKENTSKFNDPSEKMLNYFNNLDDIRLNSYEYEQLNFEVRFSITDDSDVTILKESIDTCCPLDIYDPDYENDLNVSYSKIKFMLAYDSGLLLGENIFNVLKAKRSKDENVNLKVEIIDKYTGDVILSEDLDQASFMKAGLEASTISNVIESMKTITTGALAIGAAYFLLDTNSFDTAFVNNLGSMWNNTFGATGVYASEAIDAFIKDFSSQQQSADLLKSSLGSVTDYLKGIAIDSPVKGVGLVVGAKVFNSLKDIYKNFSDLDNKKERVDDLYDISSEQGSKEDPDYTPTFSI